MIATKFCKYHLFGRCRSTICKHTHDVAAANVVSCRKMHATGSDIDKCLRVIKDNTQIEHINFGRNRIFKKHAKELAALLLSPQRRILSLCLDSTCLGRSGFITILKAAAQSPYLTYLDVADTNFIESDTSPNNARSSKKRKPKQRDSAMKQYHRKEVIDSIIALLTSTKNNIQHLIVGHNRLNNDECKTIANYADKRGLITLDLYGNNIDSAELLEMKEYLYLKRLKISSQELQRMKKVPTCISSLIVSYSVHRSQSLYRCFKWMPR